MKNLNVNYLGLDLKNPVIVSSSGLTSSLDKIKFLEKSGAGAVVLKSLFEEQIMHESASINYYDYPEANDYIAEYNRLHNIEQYMYLIADAKRECKIPIIASINCLSSGEWIEFARKIEAAGADALELNIFLLPTDKDKRSQEIEDKYLDIVSKVCDSVTIPVAVKLGPHFTNILHIVKEIYYHGAKGVIMFNRLYEPDIDINKMHLVSSDVFSSSTDLRTNLRWLALSSASVPEIDYAASTGIHDAESALKSLLAGASVVEVCSAIYKEGEGVIAKINEGISVWMETHSYSRISDFVGALNYKNIPNPVAYERSQFMKYFSSKV